MNLNTIMKNISTQINIHYENFIEYVEYKLNAYKRQQY